MLDFIRNFDFIYPWDVADEGEIDLNLELEGKNGGTAVLDTYTAEYLIEENGDEKRGYVTDRMGRFRVVENVENLERIVERQK